MLRLGTRGSPLAQWQANWVAGELRRRGVEVELVLIQTTGDVTAGSIATFGGTGVFTKEIQRALLDGRVDLAVHSLKDLPTEPVPGLALTAVPERESTRDVIISAWGEPWDQLKSESRIGTGSPRRRASLLHARPDLRMLDIRGNVETRIRKLDEGEFDAIVLAEAGLKRLELADRITSVLPRSVILPAVGQGALGLETRADDADAIAAASLLDDPPTHAAVVAERALLAELRAGCLAPVGAWGNVDGERLQLDAAVFSADGRQRVLAMGSGQAADAVQLGRTVAMQLMQLGGEQLIAAAKG